MNFCLGESCWCPETLVVGTDRKEQIQGPFQRQSVMCTVLVNCHVLFECTEKITLEARLCCVLLQIQASLSQSGPHGLSAAGRMTLPTVTKGKKTARQPKSKNIMSLRIARKQTISNRYYYCLPCDLKASAVWMGISAPEQTFDRELQLTSVNLPSRFLLGVVSNQFDGVISISCYLFFYL